MESNISCPLVSIIVPVYNTEQYLEQCIRSLVSQTYKNIEIILVDDGSTDESSAICDTWAERDNRIKVIHSENGGVSHARNIGLDYAHGEYIGFVDADDWIDANMYESMLAKMQAAGAEACGVGYVKEEENGKTICSLRREAAKVYSRDDIICEIFSCRVPQLLGWELCDKLFSKKLVTHIRFTENIVYGEDMLFLWQIIKRATKFVYLPIYGYHYRMRAGSAVNSKVTQKTLTLIKAVDKVYADSSFENDKIKKSLWNFWILTQVQIAKFMLLYSPETYREDIRKIQHLIRKHCISLLRVPHTSVKKKLGIIYLMFPFSMVVRLKKLIR